MLFLLTFACSKSSKEIEKTPSEDAPKAQHEASGLGEPRDSVCRGLVLPDIERKGCVIAGPYQGHIVGHNLSEDLELLPALEACITTPKCSGVSTAWYSDTPFVAMQKTTDFRVDTDSYGCSFIVTCTE